jgi:hypothetical protein
MKEKSIEDIIQSVGFGSMKEFILLSEKYMGFGQKWSKECPQTREEKLDYLLENPQT